jgi:hypothetical protein
MPTSLKRVAANRANARRSTGPKTPEGKARASQNARKHTFDPEPFAIVRIEDSAHIAALVADAVATYQPINSQERFAVERIALAQHSMLRMYTFEAGFFTNCLEAAMVGPADPEILKRCQVGDNIEVPRTQNRAFWLAHGFKLLDRQSNLASTFLRFQAQAERLYRRAVEDFDRLRKLRDQLPPETYETPNEPNIEPIPAPQPEENTSPPISAPISKHENEPIADPPNPTNGRIPRAPKRLPRIEVPRTPRPESPTPP